MARQNVSEVYHMVRLQEAGHKRKARVRRQAFEVVAYLAWHFLAHGMQQHWWAVLPCTKATVSTPSLRHTAHVPLLLPASSEL